MFSQIGAILSSVLIGLIVYRAGTKQGWSVLVSSLIALSLIISSDVFWLF